MNKVKLIKEYLKKIDYSIKNGDVNDQYNLQNEIIGVYVCEIDKLTHNLNTYHTIHCTKDQLTQDLFLLKSKLENYIGTLKYNHQGGGLAEIIANHPFKILGGTIITAFGLFYGALVAIMNIANTEFIIKDSYIKKDIVENQYILKEEVQKNFIEKEKFNNLLNNTISLNELTEKYISIEKHNELIMKMMGNEGDEAPTRN